MSDINYDAFYEKVGEINGWDFSDLKVTSTGESWGFYEEVNKQCKPNDIVLDIGTGGGEKVLGISLSALLLIGIDNSTSMIEAANNNLQTADVSNVRFMQMDAESLQFPDAFFDIISSRHAPFNPSEVARTLKKGATFITQQVSEGDKQNIIAAFNRDQSPGKKDGTLKEYYVDALYAAGFSEVETFDYDAEEYYERPEDLIFLLKHTPIVPNFGDDPTDYEILAKFIHDNQTDRGIMTNSKRFMIKARK